MSDPVANTTTLVKGLGGTSLGLGLTEVLAPTKVAALAGVDDAFLLGASKVIAREQVSYRLELAEQIGATTINFAETSVLEELQDITAGRGPDHCIDAAGTEARKGSVMKNPVDAYDRVKQAMRLETERPHTLREAFMSCRNAGTISIIGVYGGLIEQVPDRRGHESVADHQDRPMPRAALYAAPAGPDSQG